MPVLWFPSSRVGWQPRRPRGGVPRSRRGRSGRRERRAWRPTRRAKCGAGGPGSSSCRRPFGSRSTGRRSCSGCAPSPIATRSAAAARRPSTSRRSRADGRSIIAAFPVGSSSAAAAPGRSRSDRPPLRARVPLVPPRAVLDVRRSVCRLPAADGADAGRGGLRTRCEMGCGWMDGVSSSSAAARFGSHVVPHLARLSGVGSVTLVDPNATKAANRAGQSIEPCDVGRNKGEAAGPAPAASRAGPRRPARSPRAWRTLPLGSLRADIALPASTRCALGRR